MSRGCMSRGFRPGKKTRTVMIREPAQWGGPDSRAIMQWLPGLGAPMSVVGNDSLADMLG
jgi:hypothetical protein